MERNTFKTKSFWAGMVQIIGGIGAVAMGHVAEGLQLIATGVTTICLRDAIEVSTGK